MSIAFSDPAWRAIEHNDNQIWGVDANSIRQVAQYKVAWSIEVLATPEDGAAFHVYRWRIDCNADELALIEYVNYSATATVTDSFRNPVPVMEGIVPGTFSASLRDAVCSGVYKFEHEPYSDMLEFYEAARSYSQSPEE